MDKLFGVSLTSIMVGLLILMAGILAVIVWLALKRPVLVRMGLRNIGRRRAQTTLIVIGLMLSTLIISAAFATGDTVGYSATNLAYDTFEEVDFVLAFDTERQIASRDEAHLNDEFLALTRDRLGADPDIDGVSGILLERLPVVNASKRLSEPAASVAGVDATIDPFQGLQSLDGEPISAASLTSDGVYISEKLATAIDAREGDTVALYVENRPRSFRVLSVVRDSSLTGAGAEDLAAGGAVISLETLRTMTDRPGLLTFVIISSRGGTRDSLDLNDSVEAKIEAFLEEHPAANAHITISKADFVALAEIFGSAFVAFFLIFGLFSIAAGMMLIFLIFVMLAAERRTEMGIARAVGMSRMNLTETFLAEGLAYNVGSAAVGALAGLAVAFLLIMVLRGVFDDFGFSITFHLNPRAFIVAYGLGVVLTFVTATVSAYRAANLNIVRAIRDIPEPQPLHAGGRSVRGILLAMVGSLWTLIWIAMVSVWAAAGAALFFVGLGTFGIGLIGGGLATALFVAGARTAGRPLSRIQGWRLVLYVVWLVVFNIVALLTLGLLRTRAWAGRQRNAGGWAAWMLIFGVLLVYLGGWIWGQLFAYTAGFTFSLLALAMLAVYFGAAARPAFTTAGLALVWYWLLPLPFSLFAGADTEIDPVDGILRLLHLPRPGTLDSNIEMFFVSGVLMTVSATLVVIFNAGAILGVAGWLGRAKGSLTPALKMAIAYPLAAKFRTGLTLVMFSLVVFSLVVMATLNFNFSQLFFSEDATAGFDVVVNPNPSNPIGDLRKAMREGGYTGRELGGVGTLLATSAASTPVREDATDVEEGRYPVIGADPEFLALAKLPTQFRANGYASDAAVIEALRTDPTVAIIDDRAMGSQDEFGGDPEAVDTFRFAQPAKLRDGPWDPIPITVRDPASGRELKLRVIGVIEPQVTSILIELGGIYTSRANVERVFGKGDREIFLANVAGDPSGEASTALAHVIESTLLERGVQAESVDELIDEQAGVSTAFQLLFEGFMGLGLIVGVAALGVIAFRTVVERRQQIGMLRAIGYTRRLIALSFFFESSFIALTGIVMGLVLGTALSYNLLTSPEFTEGAAIDFRLPWIRMFAIAGIAYVASALMTWVPARSASRVAAAEALRSE